MQSLKIGKRAVGPGEPVYVVAELSANHRQDYKTAEALVRAAADAGADAVKLQTYRADTLTIDCDNKWFLINPGTPWSGKKLYDLYEEAYTPWDWQPKLEKLANSLGLDLFSSPFDGSAVDFLERELDIPVYKIASYELVDIPLLRRVAATGKPVILSTGMATEEEIGEAVEALRTGGAAGVILLKCTSAHPALPEEMNLRTIPDMMKKFGVPVGLSDHSLSAEIPAAAVALGACLVEKHLVLSRIPPGPDRNFSLEPEKFRTMTKAVRAAQENPKEALRTAEDALGAVHYGPTEREKPDLMFRRSLFVVKNMRAGEAFTPENVRSIRPGHGLAPKHLDEVLAKRAARDIERGTPLAWDLVS